MLGVDEPCPVFATGFDDACFHAIERELPVRVAGELGGWRFGGVDDGTGASVSIFEMAWNCWR